MQPVGALDGPTGRGRFRCSIEQTGDRAGRPATARPPIGRLYDVDGRRLWLHRSGTGGPAVVFLPGASAVGLDYLNIHDSISEFTTSVLYDRGGTGWSDPVGLPRTAAEGRHELQDVLHAAGVPGSTVPSKAPGTAPSTPTVRMPWCRRSATCSTGSRKEWYGSTSHEPRI